METSWFDAWLNGASTIGALGLLLVLMAVAAFLGHLLRNRRDPASQSETQEGYIVSGVLGLLALLLGFTFSLAVDRYETRRERVLEGANAIGTAYLRSQLLGEPHRTRIGNILVAYTDNGIQLARSDSASDKARMLAKDDALITELWAATAAGFDSIRNIDFSSTFVESINNLIDMDASRRTARAAHVPGAVFFVLFVYLIGTGGVLGYVIGGFGGRLAATFLMLLTVLALALILDVDRASMGMVREPQTAMQDLQKSLNAWQAVGFERWRTPIPATP